MAGILEAELGGVEDVFAGLTAAEWATATRLVPFDRAKPYWTLFELAGHFAISIGLTRMLIAEPQPGQPERDGVSFFIFLRSEVRRNSATTPARWSKARRLRRCRVSCTRRSPRPSGRRAPPRPASSARSRFRALPAMRLDEFVSSRIVEAVVHGMDLTGALGRPAIATPGGIAMTASLLDELLARRAVPGCPADLGDDAAWVRAASGRDEHPDPRLPLIG